MLFLQCSGLCKSSISQLRLSPSGQNVVQSLVVFYYLGRPLALHEGSLQINVPMCHRREDDAM